MKANETKPMDEAEIINELDGMLNGLVNVDRANDYRLLLALGFTPLESRPGLGALHEWHREVMRGEKVIHVDVILFENSVAAYISDLCPMGSGNAKTAADALRKALIDAGFKPADPSSD